MSSYSRIILPLDGSATSEQVLPYATTLAKRLAVPLRLLMAVEPERPAITQTLYSTRRWNESESFREAEATEYLEHKSVQLRNAGLEVESVILRKEPASGIVEEAGKDQDALIAMASHGRTGLARWWMGSVADKVLHLADNPVLVIRVQEQAADQSTTGWERLIVPLDGSQLAELALAHAAYLAVAMELPVTLLQANPTEAEYYSYIATGPGMLPTSAPSSPSISDMIELADNEANSYLAEVRDRLIALNVRSVETHVALGSPADCIVDLVTENPGSTVVMTTHGRSGPGRMLLGSVAERVVRHSGCPVLLVRSGQGK